MAANAVAVLALASTWKCVRAAPRDGIFTSHRALQALNAAQKSADVQPNGLNGANGNPNQYLSGGYGLAGAVPNDPTKTLATDPQKNTKVQRLTCSMMRT